LQQIHFFDDGKSTVMSHSKHHQQQTDDTKSVRETRRRLRARAVSVSVLVFIALMIWQASELWQRVSLSRIRVATAESHWSDALTWLNRLRWLQPNSTAALLAEARIWRKQGNLAKARDRLQRAKVLGHSSDELRHEEWLIQAQTGQLSEAEEPLLKALQAERDVRETLDALVQGYLRTGQYAKAEASLNTWRTIFPSDARPLVLHGQMFLQLMDWTNAKSALRQSLSKSPNDLDATLLLAESLLATHCPAEAVELFRRCHQALPERPSVAIGLSRAMIANGQAEEAVDVLRPILVRYPNLLEVRHVLSQAFLSSKRTEEAIELLQSTAQAHPNHPEIRYTLGSALRLAGRIDESEPHLAFAREADQCLQAAQRLRQLVWENPKAHAEKLELARILLNFYRVEEATIWLRNLLVDQPQHPEANRLLEECLRHEYSYQPQLIGIQHPADFNP
jgi:predicted Zn-dependent protease